jgi:uncharacterized protein (DUF2236 family)
MQVAHPVIGPGVRDFDVFTDDPWGRLDRTVSSLETQLFGGEAAVAEANRLREIHVKIKGTGFHGERYSALRPEAYAWVPITNYQAVVQHRAVFGRSLTDARQRQLWAEHRQTAMVLGIKDHHLPETIEDLAVYVDRMIAERLEHNETVSMLLQTFSFEDVPPPTNWLPAPIWSALKPFGKEVARDAVVGTLAPAMREKLGLSWTAADEIKLRAMALAVRRASPLVPDKLMHYPLAYNAMQASHEHRRLAR